MKEKKLKGYKCPECGKGILMSLSCTIGIFYSQCNKCNSYFYHPIMIQKEDKNECWKCNEIDGKVRGKIYNLEDFKIK